MKMFIDNAGDNIDAFSTHLYDGVNIIGDDNLRTGSNSQAILDIIETYSHSKWDLVKPHAITEYGTIVTRPDGEIEYDSISKVRDYCDVIRLLQLPYLSALYYFLLYFHYTKACAE